MKTKIAKQPNKINTYVYVLKIKGNLKNYKLNTKNDKF